MEGSCVAICCLLSFFLWRGFMKKIKGILLAAVLGVTCCSMPVLAAGPSGFDSAPSVNQRPSGFNHEKVTTVRWVKDKASDDDYVVLKGRFTEHLRGDKYAFVDANGDKIVAELDDDRDWSHVHQGKQYEIFAKVDKDWTRTKIEVKRAVPVK